MIPPVRAQALLSRSRATRVAYLRAADNVSRLLPIRLRGMHQPAVNT
jgi:hypothetical protein